MIQPDCVTPSPAADIEDHRVRVAATRRARMHQRLLDTVLALYQPGPTGGTVVIDDIIRAAGVARGTFYKYFDSLEAAVETLGEQLTAGMIADFHALFGDERDPCARAIGGAAMTMLRAWLEPRWAGFTCRVDHVDYFARESASDAIVRDALAAARDGGQLRFASLDVAVDIIVGMTVEGRRRLLRCDLADPLHYIDAMLDCTFRGLGMAPEAFLSANVAAWRRIHKGGSRLDWWDENRMTGLGDAR